LRAFIEKTFYLQALIRELGFAADGPDHTWADEDGWIADSHFNELIDMGHLWLYGLNARLLEVSVLLTRVALPDWVLRHLRSVRRCYALQLYEVVWVSLRALVEAASFARLVDAGIVTTGKGVTYLAEHNVRACLRDVERVTDVPKAQVAKVHRIISRANLVMHAKGATDVPSEAETSQAIQQVVDYVESLFRGKPTNAI
jgi:hypothetical protein